MGNGRRRALTRLLASLGAGWGLALFARPLATVDRLCPEYPRSRVWVVRLLGARLLAQHAAVPAGELARIVSRLAATASTSAAEAPPSSIRVRGSRVSASSGQVRGECATDGGLRISVRWELAKD